MDQPIACSLPSADYAERRAHIDDITRSALLAREPIESGARMTFAAEAEAELRELIAAEAECCSFLRMELSRSGEALALEVTGPKDAQPIIEELFA
jgi:hypothetical protein